jgi:hypothetical protein
MEVAAGEEIEELGHDPAGHEHGAGAADHGQIADDAAQQGTESEYGFARDGIAAARGLGDRRGRPQGGDRGHGSRTTRP